MEAPIYDVYAATCPSRQALDLVADKWTVLIIGLLAKHPHRFGQLRRAIGGISQKMLTQTLRALERDGLVSRTVYAEVPPRVEYSLTDLGRSLITPIDAVRAWADQNAERILTTQARHDRAKR
jgi:DNA-binding HxlR family transcriptional regulator